MELGKTKAKIERYAKENNVDVQVAWDSFFFDEFLLIFLVTHRKYLVLEQL